MDEGGNDKNVLDLFTKHFHHQSITVIYLCQDLFPAGKFARTISQNAHYIAAFKNPRDQLGLRNLLQQPFPTQFREVMDTFRKVTNERSFAYMLLDLHPASRDDQRILSLVLKWSSQILQETKENRGRKTQRGLGTLEKKTPKREPLDYDTDEED